MKRAAKGASVPLRRDLAKLLADWIDSTTSAGATSRDRLFYVPAQLVKILDRDLEFAGIAKTDASGRTIDVHALRHTFGTLLAKSGATVKESQLAMRHSKVELTMNTYADPQLVNVAGAVESLPSLAPCLI